MDFVEKVKQGIKNCIDKKHPCGSCEYSKKQRCTSYWLKDALSVIESLQAKIEETETEISELKKQTKFCFGECAYLPECNPVDFAICEKWKGGDIE